MTAIWVEITATRGSAPRDAGTAMMVTAHDTQGTIGGGALEHRAIAKARTLLSQPRAELHETLPLGPGLGQCCGGAVSLAYRHAPRATDDMPASALSAVPFKGPQAPLWVWGAGHVGRAVVAAAPTQAFDITWIDSAPDRFPVDIPTHATALPTPDMPRLAAHAPQRAHHLIFTYSHDIDLALCAALLRRGAGSVGLIGSDTKWARFRKRLAAQGLDPSGILCPIGDKRLGKRPDQIAHGTVKALLTLLTEKAAP